MCDLVESIEEIIQNIKTLEQYASGSDDERKFHHDIIKKGKGFVTLKENDKYKFSPSRFVGYKKNDTNHLDKRENRHGGKTNTKLDKILGSSYKEGDLQYKEIDDAFISYCAQYSIVPINYIKEKRHYWYIGSKNIRASRPIEPTGSVNNSPFSFVAGFTPKKSSTTASLIQTEQDIKLRHNDIQKALYNELVDRHGKENVGVEQHNGIGGFIDVVLRSNSDEYWFYEIKPKLVRYCIREALGQLLEYSYWPKTQKAKRLIVVGEAELDKEGEEYLKYLRTEFNLPVYYQSIKVLE